MVVAVDPFNRAHHAARWSRYSRCPPDPIFTAYPARALQMRCRADPRHRSFSSYHAGCRMVRATGALTPHRSIQSRFEQAGAQHECVLVHSDPRRQPLSRYDARRARSRLRLLPADRRRRRYARLRRRAAAHRPFMRGRVGRRVEPDPRDQAPEVSRRDPSGPVVARSCRRAWRRRSTGCRTGVC